MFLSDTDGLHLKQNRARLSEQRYSLGCSSMRGVSVDDRVMGGGMLEAAGVYLQPQRKEHAQHDGKSTPVAALHSIKSSVYQPLQVDQVMGQDGA